jgi:hypothetical protein
VSQAAGIMAGMEPVTAPLDAVAFSSLARRLAAEARALGLAVPGFRSPPRHAGAVRTLRRVAGGGCIVAVRRRERPGGEVAADLVDGVLAANGLLGAAGSGHRATLLAAAARARSRAPREAA